MNWKPFPRPHMTPARRDQWRPLKSLIQALMEDLGAPSTGKYRKMMLRRKETKKKEEEK